MTGTTPPADDDTLRQRLTQALAREDVHWGYDHGFSPRGDEETNAFADAVMAVVQPEIDRLRAERDKLAATIDRMKRTNRMVNGAAREARERAEQAEAERERLAVAVQRVRELHREWKRSPDDPFGYCAHCEKDDDVVRWPCPTIAALGESA